jgi:hypothetical protein
MYAVPPPCVTRVYIIHPALLFLHIDSLCLLDTAFLLIRLFKAAAQPAIVGVSGLCASQSVAPVLEC